MPAACASTAPTPPDPTFSEDGGSQVRIGKGSGIDMDDAGFQEAQEQCADKLGGILERRP